MQSGTVTMPVDEEASVAEEETLEEDGEDVAPPDPAPVSSVAPQAKTTTAAALSTKKSSRCISTWEAITVVPPSYTCSANTRADIRLPPDD